MMYKVDIAIVGAGMVGLTLARALQVAGCKVAVIDPQPWRSDLPDEPSLRVSAINAVNQQALARLGVWQHLPLARQCAYTHMSVCDQDSFGRIDFSHQLVAQACLGHIVENPALTHALAAAIDNEAGVLAVTASIRQWIRGDAEQTLLMDNDSVISCKLLVGADGAHSWVRQRAEFPLTFYDYGHTAMVATLRTQQPHQQVARQVFTPTGPIALLPLADPHLVSLVWSQDTHEAERLASTDERTFARALTAATGSWLGVVELVSERLHFPLTMRYAQQWVDDGVAIVGDAAHTIHPLAGQGANLGMQDALMLAQQITMLKDAQQPFYLARQLRAYERARKTEAVAMITAMQSFKSLFAGAHPLKKLLRGTGLLAANAVTPLKRQLIKQAMGW